jgi:hypothetical protein
MHEGDPFSNSEELSAPEEVAQHWLGYRDSLSKSSARAE